MLHSIRKHFPVNSSFPGACPGSLQELFSRKTCCSFGHGYGQLNAYSYSLNVALIKEASVSWLTEQSGQFGLQRLLLLLLLCVCIFAYKTSLGSRVSGFAVSAYLSRCASSLSSGQAPGGETLDMLRSTGPHTSDHHCPTRVTMFAVSWASCEIVRVVMTDWPFGQLLHSFQPQY